MSAFAVAVKELKRSKDENEFNVSDDAKNIIACLFKKTIIGNDSDYKIDLNISSENVKLNPMVALAFTSIGKDSNEEVLSVSNMEKLKDVLTLRDRNLAEELKEQGVEFKVKHQHVKASLNHLYGKVTTSEGNPVTSKLAVFLSF